MLKFWQADDMLEMTDAETGGSGIRQKEKYLSTELDLWVFNIKLVL